MKKDEYATKTTTDEECVVILNGVKMRRDEQGNYHEIKSHSERANIFPFIVLFMSVCLLFVSIAPLAAKFTAGSKPASESINTLTEKRVANKFSLDPYIMETNKVEEEEDSEISYTLTVCYVNESGAVLCPELVKLMRPGVSFSIASPAIDGYTPDFAVITGVMGNNDVSYRVTYCKNVAEAKYNQD